MSSTKYQTRRATIQKLLSNCFREQIAAFTEAFELFVQLDEIGFVESSDLDLVIWRKSRPTIHDRTGQ
jgi:hypothetical protein